MDNHPDNFRLAKQASIFHDIILGLFQRFHPFQKYARKLQQFIISVWYTLSTWMAHGRDSAHRRWAIG